MLLELRIMRVDPLKSDTFLAGASGEWMEGTFWEAMAQKGEVRCSGGVMGREAWAGFCGLSGVRCFRGGWKAVQFFRLVLPFFGSKRL